MSLIHGLLTNLPAFVINALRLLAWLTLLTAIFVPLERIFAVRQGSPSSENCLHDLGYYFLSGLLPSLILGAPLALVAIGVQHLMPVGLLAALGAMSLPCKLLLAFVIGEIGFYWGHRLSHEIPWMWRFHAVHHSPEHLYFLVNTRSHPVDLVLTRLFGMIPLYALGLAGPSIAGSLIPVMLMLTGTVWGFFIHANLRVSLGAFEWLLSTPRFHHWHHSRVDHINRNYASMLPVLDKLFGTLHLPREWPSSYGTQTPLSDSFLDQLIDPLRPSSARTYAAGPPDQQRVEQESLPPG